MIEEQLLSYVKQLACELEFDEKLEQDAFGAYNIAFSKTLRINIATINDGFYFSSNLGSCPEKNSEEFFILIMHANLFGIGTGGGVIGLSQEGKTIFFSLYYPQKTSYKQFKDLVEEFVNWVDMWQKKSEDARAYSA
jgi:hypothetical protein